jgi:hypothetical protein
VTVSYTIPSAKHPHALLDYTHDFADDLLLDGEDVGDALIPDNYVDATKWPTVVCVRGECTVTQFSLSGTKLTYWVEGGLKNKDAHFELTVWTAQGRRLVVVTILPIKDG